MTLRRRTALKVAAGTLMMATSTTIAVKTASATSGKPSIEEIAIASRPAARTNR